MSTEPLIDTSDLGSPSFKALELAVEQRIRAGHSSGEFQFIISPYPSPEWLADYVDAHGGKVDLTEVANAWNEYDLELLRNNY